MILTMRTFAGFVLIVSAIVLGAALASQYWGGLIPCELCILQRWPWAAAIMISLVALFPGLRRGRLGSRPALPPDRSPEQAWVALVLVIVYAVGVAFAAYHVGVEQHWWAGPTACTAPAGGAATLEAMKQQILGTPAVLCDQVQWSLFGVSLAGWNLLASLGMAAICAAVFAGTRRRVASRASLPRRPSTGSGAGAAT
jgi:disulfide bond formation protein DsbB